MGLAALQRQLVAGWTTVRVMGDADVHYANQDIRKTIEKGVFIGPRLTGAGRFEVLHRDAAVGLVRWPLIGMHNVENGLAAIACAAGMGVEASRSAESRTYRKMPSLSALRACR